MVSDVIFMKMGIFLLVVFNAFVCWYDGDKDGVSVAGTKRRELRKVKCLESKGFCCCLLAG